MLDMLKLLADSSVPTLLMGLGGILFLLAFVQKIGTQVELPKERQWLAAIAGVVLMGIGMLLQVFPAVSPPQVAEARSGIADVPLVTVQYEPEQDRRLAGVLPDRKTIAGIFPGLTGTPDSFSLTIQEVIDDWEQFKPEFRAVLDQSGYRGEGLELEGDCTVVADHGGIQGYLIIAEAFRDAEAARAYWSVLQRALAAESDELRKLGDGSLVDAWEEDCDGVTQAVYNRHRLERNVVFFVGLTAPGRTISEPAFAAGSDALLASMLGRIGAVAR